MLDPVWNRNGPNMTTLPNQVHNRPVVFAPLEKVKGQFGEFPTTQSAAQQNGEKRSIALTFEGLGPGRLPETASLLGRQPIPKANTNFCAPLTRRMPAASSGLSSPASAAS